MQEKEKKVEKKEMFLFDEKKFIVGLDHANYSIEYELFKSDVDTSEMTEKNLEKICTDFVKRDNQACFSQFSNSYAEYFKKTKCRPNRIRFFCNRSKHNKESIHLNKKEIKSWVKLCKDNNLMPSNIGKNFIKNGIYDVCFEDLSLETFYIYLCSGRYVQEEPYFVRGVLHLIEDHNMGFFTAFCLASYYQTSNTGHHILPFSRDYAISQMPKSLNAPTKSGFGNSFNFIHAAKLYNFVYGGDSGKHIKDMSIPLPHVNLHDKMSKSWLNGNNSLIYRVSREDLIDKDLEHKIKTGEFTKSAST